MRERIYSDEMTPREKEVFKLLAHGLSNKEIAEQLGIVETTLRTHIFHIYEKLYISNKATEKGVLRVRAALRYWQLPGKEQENEIFN